MGNLFLIVFSLHWFFCLFRCLFLAVKFFASCRLGMIYSTSSMFDKKCDCFHRLLEEGALHSLFSCQKVQSKLGSRSPSVPLWNITKEKKMGLFYVFWQIFWSWLWLTYIINTFSVICLKSWANIYEFFSVIFCSRNCPQHKEKISPLS